MYFINEEHKKNYRKLMELYKLQSGEDVSIEANIYISGHPELYKLFNQETLGNSRGPLAQLGYSRGESLSFGAYNLIEAGRALSERTGVCLEDVVTSGHEVLQIFIEACKIRAGEYIIPEKS